MNTLETPESESQDEEVIDGVDKLSDERLEDVSGGWAGDSAED